MRAARLALLLCGSATIAAAQERAVSFEEPPAVVVSGFAVGTASHDRNLEENTFAGSKIALSLFRPWGDHLYLFAQLTTHLEAPADPTQEPETHVGIDNLIVNWTPPGATALSLAFGRFDAPLGFERDDEPLNLIPTNSFNFALARPAKLTGAMARYALGPRATVGLWLANGWNEELDNNTGKTVGARLQLFPATGVAVGLNALYGPEEEGTNGKQRTLVTADATLQPMSPFILGLEVNRGWQRDAGTNFGWTGAVATAFWRFARTFGLSVRGEVLDDADGVRTGTPQTLRSLTISPWYFYREAQEGVFTNVEHTTFRLPALSVRPAIRFDDSDQAFFPDAAGGLRQSNVSAVLEFVYVF
ncbi:MAG: outer membrane beta-barrel protein [Gemmatimonadales bacterium]